MPSLTKQQHFMIRNSALSLFALIVLVSCASHVSTGPYQPVSKPEKIEFAHDRVDVYPDDIRQSFALHTNAAVAWVGVIRSTDAYEANEGDQILADTIFEHHYFNWIQDGHGHGAKLYVSPRGEGLFRAKWHMDKTTLEASVKNAEEFAGKGKLAVVYGVPAQVDTNGTVVLKYRYLRILDATHFDTNTLDYGRWAKPIVMVKAAVKTNAPPMNSH